MKILDELTFRKEINKLYSEFGLINKDEVKKIFVEHGIEISAKDFKKLLDK